jgi:hypothetical protein
MRKIFIILILITCPLFGKEQSVFFPKERIKQASMNVKKFPWAANIQKGIIKTAEPWVKMSDDELWGLVFGPTIKRSWMVWSNGVCPSCKKSVPMYTWKVNALKHRWKVQCPHCSDFFPKNDFYAFYKSGLDEYGVFDPKKANRTLLKGPKGAFGVDDGEGYVNGKKRWRFIGAYLIYGQWKQLVVGGIRKLSAAYTVTGDPKYAHKAGILIDRVADLYPLFDFKQQGLVYERRGDAGYVSTWHDACEETREIVIAYDQIFDGIKNDRELVAFLSRKAKQYKLENQKSTFKDIQKNIEDRILRDALKNKGKIKNNYPRTDVCVAVICTVLGLPGAKESIYKRVGGIVRGSTKVDGVTGEKGLAAYSAYTISSLAMLLGQYADLDPQFLKEFVKKYPSLKKAFRFHLDMWCLDQQFYPNSGDSGNFGQKCVKYKGAYFKKYKTNTSKKYKTNPEKNPLLPASMFSFFWNLYEATGDPDYVKVLYKENDHSVENLPYDIFAKDPAGFQKKVASVIKKEGKEINLKSVNKQQWRIAVMRSGKDTHKRALWIDYDVGGNHCHSDGMNFGLYAKGLELIPEFGYKPVQFGGWHSRYANWYGLTVGHNTVVVDGRNQRNSNGKTTLWAVGDQFNAFRMSGTGFYGTKQYERTGIIIDISDNDFYVVDLFRVVGGKEHVYSINTFFGQLAVQGANCSKPSDFKLKGAIIRNAKQDPDPKPGWFADIKIEDRYSYLPKGSDVHLRISDLTQGAHAIMSEAWVAPGGFNQSVTAWIPRVMKARRSVKPGLASAFVSIIEPYEKKSNISSTKRLPLTTVKGEIYSDANAAVEISLANKMKDLVIARDVDDPLARNPVKTADALLVQPDWNVKTDAQICWIRKDKNNKIVRAVLCKGTRLEISKQKILLPEKKDVYEIEFKNGKKTEVK